MIQIIPGCRCHFFAFWPDHNSLTRIILLQHSDWAVSRRLYCFAAFVKLCFDCRRTHALSFSVFLFSPLSSDSNGLGECSCDSVALRQKVAALWMWGEREKKRDCFQIAQAPKKKRHFFHFLPGLQGKKYQEGGKDCRGRGWGKLLGTVQRSEFV